VTIVKSDRPETRYDPVVTKLCSSRCTQALREFYEELVGVTGEVVGEDDLPAAVERARERSRRKH
jgi:hypothetical protein